MDYKDFRKQCEFDFDYLLGAQIDQRSVLEVEKIRALYLEKIDEAHDIGKGDSK